MNDKVKEALKDIPIIKSDLPISAYGGIDLDEFYKTIDRLNKILFEKEKVEQENQQLKKQKDDVVEYIKKNWYSRNTRDINEIVIGDWRIVILRMLGEIE